MFNTTFLFTDIYNIFNLFLILFTISFIIFYLDGFKLSSFKFIKIFQLLSFFILPFIFVLYLVDTLDTICSVKENVGLYGHISIDKEGAKYIGQGMNTIGSQVGLGATMAGVSTAVAKGIAKSSMPPVQKIGAIIGGAVIGGFSHSIITGINRNAIYLENASSYNKSNNIGSNISKLIDDSLSSPLQTLLFDIEGLNITCLSLVIILSIQIIFKFYLKDSVNLNLSSLLGSNLNNNLQIYINKIISLNKKMSVVYI